MLAIVAEVAVRGLTGREVTEFMLACTDERYRAWWPGTHLQLHPVGAARAGVGDVMLMDEFVGRRRLRMHVVVEAVEPGRRIVWRFRRIVALPARLCLELFPAPGGVVVRHTVTAGWAGIGRALDPLLRLYLTPGFTADLEEHVRTEFPLLRDHLRGRTEACAGD